MIELKDRYEILLRKKIRVFYHSDFENNNNIKSILDEMPNYEKYKKEKVKSVSGFNRQTMSMEMQPCYQNPLLDKEQEQYFFKKYNYYKFLAKTTLESINPKRLSKNKIIKAEKLFETVEYHRNEIALSNFRLAFHALKKSLSVLEQADASVMLSNAYVDIIKAVDYFNFTLGIKFSTYCVWVLKKNASKIFKGIQKDRQLIFCSFGASDDDGDNDCNYEVPDKSSKKTSENHEIKDAIKTLLDKFKKRFPNRETERELFILENYFGLDQKTPLTLEGISGFLNISKERVRQLKEGAFVNLRILASELNITL